MEKRRRLKNKLSLNDRLKIFSDQLKAQASRAVPGPERDEMLKRAHIADAAANFDDWANSTRPRPPR